MPRLLGLLVLVMPIIAWGAVYKYRDETTGRIVFSDRPHPGAERMKIDPLQTYKSTPSSGANNLPPPPTDDGSAPASGGDTSQPNTGENATPQYDITITSPGPGEAVRDNAGNVTIAVSITPFLAADDNVIILMDGQKISGPGKATTASIQEVSRGEHHIDAQIVNASGQVVKSTQSLFYLLRAAKRLPLSLGLQPSGNNNFVLNSLLSLFTR